MEINQLKQEVLRARVKGIDGIVVDVKLLEELLRPMNKVRTKLEAVKEFQQRFQAGYSFVMATQDVVNNLNKELNGAMLDEFYQLTLCEEERELTEKESQRYLRLYDTLTKDGVEIPFRVNV